MKSLQKKLYAYAYLYAKKCQRKYFIEYLSKYIEKHIKYKKRNEQEYPLLILMINRDVDVDKHHEQCRIQLSKAKESLVPFLYDKNREIHERKKKDYGFSLLENSVHIQKMYLECDHQEPNLSDKKVLHDIVTFSFHLQKIFSKSDLVAKTKIQEHWFMRLPIFVVCATLIFFLKMYEEWGESVMKLLIIIVVYIFSIYMVMIRFHQSVLAETKKLCSETYSRHKHSLYQELVNNV